MGSNRGMTLVELVLVMSLVGILAFVAAPRFNAYQEIELRAATHQLAADIRYAQSRAIATRVRHGVTFDTANARYSVYRENPSTPVTDFLDPGRAMTRSLEGVTLSSASFDGSSDIEFDSMGTPYASGSELGALGAVVLVGTGGTVDSVTVSPLTGRIAW